jgi:hypothetical protein
MDAGVQQEDEGAGRRVLDLGKRPTRDELDRLRRRRGSSALSSAFFYFAFIPSSPKRPKLRIEFSRGRQSKSSSGAGLRAGSGSPRPRPWLAGRRRSRLGEKEEEA